MFAPAAVADLKPGEKIFVVAGKKQPDGTVLAPSIVVGHNGVNPPMCPQVLLGAQRGTAIAPQLPSATNDDRQGRLR